MMTNKELKILNDFIVDMKAANALTLADTEGLHDGSELEHEEYVENRQNGIFSEAQAALDWTYEGLLSYYSRNWEA